MSASNYVHLDVKLIKRETKSAFLLVIESEELEGEFWFPKSQIASADDYSAGDENCTISVRQ